MIRLDHFVEDVAGEVVTARRKFPNQEETLTPHEWYAILAEEVGEVARGLNEGGISGPGSLDRGGLYEELVQVAAMAGRMALSVKNGG